MIKQVILIGTLFLSLHATLLAENMPDLVNEGAQAYQQGNYKLAYEKFLIAANNGDSQAQSNLGGMYFSGQGINIDYQQAKHWLDMAIKKQNPSAYYNLAYLYFYGKGVQKNIPEAIALYQTGAHYNDLGSQRRLGFLYMQGQVIPRDLVKSYLYFSLAAQNNDQTSANMLAVVSKQMTQAQLDEANQLVKNFKFEGQ